MDKGVTSQGRSTGSNGEAGRASRRAGAVEPGDLVRTASAQVRAASVPVGEAIGAVRASLPTIARSSRELVNDAVRELEVSSDQRVSAAAAMSLGLAIGMLLGSAPRLLVALVLTPVAVLAIVLMDRRAGTRSRSGAS